jgi:two-component system, NtrC family, sensor kinase
MFHERDTREGIDVLRRRSIRTKLFVALMLLSAIVSVLAASSFWGLYRYRNVAEAVGRRATELPMANDLHRWALALRDSHFRLTELLQQEGMIESSLLDGSLIKHERDVFEEAIIECEITLDRYITTVSDESQRASVFIDTQLRRESLDLIHESLGAISQSGNKPTLGEQAGQQQYDVLLQKLVSQTSDHLKLIHGGMSEFSGDVRGEYRAWIAAAWISLGLAVFLVVALLWLFSSLIVQPFRTLLVGSRLVAGGQLEHRIDLGTGDELCELAEAMNDMTNRFQQAYQQLNDVCSDLDRQVQQRSREVIQNEQLASVGFLAAGVAHEINNPLATIAWSAESLESRLEDLSILHNEREQLNDDAILELHTNLRRIQDEAFRCKGITERLLNFSRLGEFKRTPTNLTALVRDVVDMVSKVGEYRCKTIRMNCEDDTIADVNPQEIRQVVLNLLTNSLECVDCDGAVDIDVQRSDENVLISVQDDGCGMTPEVLQHLFEPFFTRRSNGNGTGLGLSISYRIVSQHGGTLVPHSEGPGKGSRMELLLPIHANSSTKNPHSIAIPTWKHESYQAA